MTPASNEKEYHIMQEIDLALEMLHAILDEKVPFSEALRRRFQSDLAVRPMRQDVAGIVGCELRHHLLFRYVLKADFPEEDKMRLVALALANHYFFRRFPAEKVFAVLADALTEEEIAKVRPYLEGNRGADELLGENMRHTSNLYLSLRYNTPEWVLKIFQHYGYGQTYKILRSYARPRQNVVRVLTEEVTMEDLCSGGEFAPSKAYPDLIADHTGKTSLRKFPAYRSGAFFDIKPFFHKILLDHPVDAPRQILLYNGNPMSGFERDLIALYGDRIGLNVACPSVEKRPEVSRLIRGKKASATSISSPPRMAMGSRAPSPRSKTS